MTRDHFRKKAVRAHAAGTGRTFLDAATSLSLPVSGDDGTVLAARLRDDLVTALDAAGWPVVIEHHPQFHALLVYAGPASIHVRRDAKPPSIGTGDEHPDDPAFFDLTAPLMVTVWAPLIVEYSDALDRVVGVDAHEIAATLPPEVIVAEIDRVVGQARRREVAGTPLDATCGICGDDWAGIGLAQPARPRVAVCPCCAFDGDLLGAEPGKLAFDLDQASSQNLAVPAGWAGVEAVLRCLAGPGLPAWLEEDWRRAGTVYRPRESWGGADRMWVWLPPVARRPAALAGLGCGASLARVVAAVDQAHPDGRERFHAHLAQELEIEVGETGEEDQVPAEVVERFWPAVVAYTVGLLTQQAERPGQRSPWHVLESLELSEWAEILAPNLDVYPAETLLHGGIITVRELLVPIPSRN